MQPRESLSRLVLRTVLIVLTVAIVAVPDLPGAQAHQLAADRHLPGGRPVRAREPPVAAHEARLRHHAGLRRNAGHPDRNRRGGAAADRERRGRPGPQRPRLRERRCRVRTGQPAPAEAQRRLRHHGKAGGEGGRAARPPGRRRHGAARRGLRDRELDLRPGDHPDHDRVHPGRRAALDRGRACATCPRNGRCAWSGCSSAPRGPSAATWRAPCSRPPPPGSWPTSSCRSWASRSPRRWPWRSSSWT